MRKLTDKNCQEREIILRKLFILVYFFSRYNESVKQVKVVQEEAVYAANVSLN